MMQNPFNGIESSVLLVRQLNLDDNRGIHSMELKDTVIIITDGEDEVTVKNPFNGIESIYSRALSDSEIARGIHSMELKDCFLDRVARLPYLLRNPFNGIERLASLHPSILNSLAFNESIQWN
jgi:hypothetical protein